jgi:hypothetical protein
MYLKKGICIFLSAAAILTTAVALDRSHRDNWGKTQADGGGPTPPPVPWPITAIDSPRFIADGGGPTPPPVPWGSASTDMELSRS